MNSVIFWSSEGLSELKRGGDVHLSCSVFSMPVSQQLSLIYIQLHA